MLLKNTVKGSLARHPFFKRHIVQTIQLPYIDMMSAGKRVVGRADEHKLVCRQRNNAKSLALFGVYHDSQIKSPAQAILVYT